MSFLVKRYEAFRIRSRYEREIYNPYFLYFEYSFESALELIKEFCFFLF